MCRRGTLLLSPQNCIGHAGDAKNGQNRGSNEGNPERKVGREDVDAGETAYKREGYQRTSEKERESQAPLLPAPQLARRERQIGKEQQHEVVLLVVRREQDHR